MKCTHAKFKTHRSLLLHLNWTNWFDTSTLCWVMFVNVTKPLDNCSVAAEKVLLRPQKMKNNVENMMEIYLVH